MSGPRELSPLLCPVRDYYAGKLGAHGATALGVDWNSERSQLLRFEQLARVTDGSVAFSLNDLGCGYGGLHAFLERRGARVDYLGIDISPDMIASARAFIGSRPGVRLLCASEPDRPADFGVASGIFNVRVDANEADWGRHVLATLDSMHASSRRGFAFNCLTSYADKEKMRADLHYADPLSLFDHCKRRYSRDVALLHDYGLYEFTLIVRKEG